MIEKGNDSTTKTRLAGILMCLHYVAVVEVIETSITYAFRHSIERKVVFYKNAIRNEILLSEEEFDLLRGEGIIELDREESAWDVKQYVYKRTDYATFRIEKVANERLLS
ncbi:MAG: hypothetical protein JWM20_623 [Patescibacteria group bacterium]|nr:hypothetical protein [Patescibacteria group bacterium]